VWTRALNCKIFPGLFFSQALGASVGNQNIEPLGRDVVFSTVPATTSWL
jgi:hypothetical protein